MASPLGGEVGAALAMLPLRRLRGRIGTMLAWVLAVLLLLYLVVLPLGTMVLDAFTDEDGGLTLYNIANLFADPHLRQAAINSLVVAAAVTALGVVIGGTLAFGVERTGMRGKAAVRATMILSLVMPDFLLAMAYVILAGPNAGYLNLMLRHIPGVGGSSGPLDIFSLPGLVLTALPHGVSYVFLALTPALRNLDPALEEAARVHGSGVRSMLRRVGLPLMRPALLSGALLGFAGSLAMYGPPELLRLNVLTVAIREALVQLDFKTGSVASLLLVLISVMALLAYRRSTRRAERYRTLGGKSFAPRPLDIGGWTLGLTAFGVLYVLATLVMPYGTLLAVSFMHSIGEGASAGNWTWQNYVTVFRNDAVRGAASLSIGLATISATCVVAMGLLIAGLIVRGRLPGKGLLDIVASLPFAVPGTALGIALITVYLNPPFNLLGFYGSFDILLVAYLARFLTFGVRISQSTLIQLAPELEEASRVSGASAVGTAFRILLPLMRTALGYEWVLVFVLALPELSASIVLKGVHTQTLSTVLLDVWNGNGGLVGASALGMCIFIGIALLLAVAGLVKSKEERTA